MKISNLFGTKLSGTIGKSVTVYTMRGRQFMRVYVVPRNPKTKEQQRRRTAFSKAVEAWRRLTPKQKEFYRGIAKDMTGFNLFISRFIRASTAGHEPEMPEQVDLRFQNLPLGDSCSLAVRKDGRSIFSVGIESASAEIPLTRLDVPYVFVLFVGTSDELAVELIRLPEAGVPVVLEHKQTGIRLTVIVRAPLIGTPTDGDKGGPAPQSLAERQSLVPKAPVSSGSRPLRPQSIPPSTYDSPPLRPYQSAAPQVGTLWKIGSAADSLLVNCGFSSYLRQTQSIANESLKRHSNMDWPGIVEHLRTVEGLFKTLPRTWRLNAARVASSHLAISRKACEERSAAYIEYCRSFDDGSSIGRDVRQAVKRDSVLSATAEETPGMGRLVRLMSELLSSYKRQVSYLAGLAMYLRSEDMSVKGLVLKPTLYLENLLYEHNDGYSNGLLFGEEYNHIHRAMTDSQVRYSVDRMTLRLRHGRSQHTPSWHHSYPYEEFATMVRNADVWERGWILGRTLELIELDAFVETSGHAEEDEESLFVEPPISYA